MDIFILFLLNNIFFSHHKKYYLIKKMNTLCQYKNILGEPNTNFRKIRIFDISVIDVVVVVIFCYYISIYLKKPFWITLVIIFILGIIIHRLFCVRTRVDRWLFPDK